MVIRRLALLGVLVGGIFSVPECPAAEQPSYLSVPEDSGVDGAIDAKEILKEAETLQRKANLVKEMAVKKFAEAKRLQNQAGGYRSQASAASLAAQQRAASNLDTTNMLGGILGLLGSVSPVQTPDRAAGLGMTSLLVSNTAAGEARTLAEEQAAGGKMEMQAERKAGPLEMKAQALEDDANRLLAAFNRLQSLANARYLLAASEQLRRAVLEDRDYLAEAGKRFR